MGIERRLSRNSSFGILAASLTFLFVALSARPSLADVTPGVLPDIVEWTEQGRSGAVGGGLVVWAPNGSVGVEASGLNNGYHALGAFGIFNASIAHVVNESMVPIGELYPLPILVRSAHFTPNGTWFVATFDLPPSSPFAPSTPEFDNISLHWAIWAADSWALIEDRVVGKYLELYSPNASFTPADFSLSPDGNRIALWDYSSMVSIQRARLEIRTFPALVEISNHTFATGIFDAQWSPSGSLLAVALGNSPAPATGELLLVNGTTMSVVQAIYDSNVFYSGLSWSPDGDLLVAKVTAYSYFASPCTMRWATVQVSIRAYETTALAMVRELWLADATGEPCGMGLEEDSRSAGANGSAAASFHPSLGYVLLSHGDQVEVVNASFWEVVFSANLSSAGQYLVSQAAWAGAAGSFSFVVLGLTDPLNGTGWALGVASDRATYPGRPHTPSASFRVYSSNGTTDLFPGLVNDEFVFEITTDSVARVYSSIALAASAPLSSITIAFRLEDEMWLQEAGAAFILVQTMTSIHPWDGHRIEAKASLLSSWNVSHDGNWTLAASARLSTGALVAADATGGLFTHVKVEIVGPFSVVDEARGLLAAGALLNSTPTLSFAWGQARFVFGQRPLDPAGFVVDIRGRDGVLASRFLQASLAGAAHVEMVVNPSATWLRVSLRNSQSTAIDVTDLVWTFQIDDTVPRIFVESPQSGSWVTNTTIVIGFSTSDGGSGVSLEGAQVVVSEISGVAEFSRAPATVKAGAAGDAIAHFEAVVILPPGESGVVRLRVLGSDMVGNWGNFEIELLIDRQGPVILVTPWPSWLNVATVSLEWICEDAGVGVEDTPQVLQYHLPPTAVPSVIVGTVQSAAATRVAIRANFVAGEGETATVAFNCVDRLGNIAATPPVSLRVDTTAPRLAIESPGSQGILAGSNQTATLRIFENGSGMLVDGVVCEVSVDEGQTFVNVIASRVSGTPIVEGRFECHITLVEGRSSRLVVSAVDNANNTARLGSITLRVNVPPTAVIQSPQMAATYTSNWVELAALVSDEDEDVVRVEWVLVIDGTVLATGARANITLPAGAYSIELRVEDSAGHVRIQTVDFAVVDPTAAAEEVPWLALVVLVIAVIAVLLVVRSRRKR